jgi:molybdopterin-guanine dinucleotide biosynthesis protein A
MPTTGSTAAVLVGGEGRRLGGVAKHTLVYGNGETVLARLVKLLTDEVGPVTLVSRHPMNTPLPVVLDAFAEKGAAAGLHAALSHAPPGWVFVAACDLPALDAATIRRLAAARAGQDVVLARTGPYLQTLAAFWHTRALDAVAAGLEAGRPSLKSLVAALDATVIECADEAPFANVNRPEDLDAHGLSVVTPRTRAARPATEVDG